jgi:aldose 1-epimerase
MESVPFGRLPDGRVATLHTLTNRHGLRADITDYGGTIVRLFVPDRTGRLDDVVLGFNALEDYARSTAYLGPVVGRVANRIAHGRFSLDGRTHQLPTKNTLNGGFTHLHGGHMGFDKVLWSATPEPNAAAPALVLRHHSPDGDEGYPGNLDVTVRYTLSDDNALHVDYTATTDRATPVNLTQHSYFNLKGDGQGDILDHEITLHASRYTPVNASLIPTGQIAPVAGTPLDFTRPCRIGARIDDDHEQLRIADGYDHNYVLDHPAGSLGLSARVSESTTGRVLEVHTDQPGVQFYTGNFLDGTPAGKRGARYVRRGGFCLETQHFPDSPNQPAFPDTILRPGQTYRTSTVFAFSAR